MSGPDVPLSPRLAVVLSMILHEIATNAAKYGALSNDTGKVALDWEVITEDAKPQLRLIWTESGGPHVTAPVQRGFGSRLIERSARDQLGGEATVDFLPRGVVYTVTCTLERELFESESDCSHPRNGHGACHRAIRATRWSTSTGSQREPNRPAPACLRMSKIREISMRLAKMVLAGSMLALMSSVTLAQQALTGTVTMVNRISETITIRPTQSGTESATVGANTGGTAEQFKAQGGMLDTRCMPATKSHSPSAKPAEPRPSRNSRRIDLRKVAGSRLQQSVAADTRAVTPPAFDAARFAHGSFCAIYVISTMARAQ